MSIVSKLSKVQQELKAPKGKYNNFGKYKYRSCEDILESVKPLLDNCIITVSDDITVFNEMVYVKSTVKFSDGKEEIETTAFARESVSQKGMSDAQVTGSASSYARKYALNGLLLIDDTEDDDSKEVSNDETMLKSCKTVDELGKMFKSLPDNKQKALSKLVTELKLELSNGGKQ